MLSATHQLDEVFVIAHKGQLTGNTPSPPPEFLLYAILAGSCSVETAWTFSENNGISQVAFPNWNPWFYSWSWGKFSVGEWVSVMGVNTLNFQDLLAWNATLFTWDSQHQLQRNNALWWIRTCHPLSAGMAWNSYHTCSGMILICDVGFRKGE